MITANCQDKDYDERHKLKNIELVGLDSYKPALKYLSRLQIYDALKNIDLNYGLEDIKHLHFNIAIAYGVMAHLKKDVALSVVTNMLELADYAIVTAPTQMVQHENISNSANVEQLQHKSIFTCKDFEKLGLQTRLLSYKENPEKMTTLNTFITPYTFSLSALHHKLKERLKIPLSLTHWLNYFGDGIIAWRARK